jgi:carbon storage regulator
MLVLTRRTEESVVIGDNIVVTVLGVEGEKVKLGIDAPREVTILRRELLDVLKQQTKLADKLASMPEPPAVDSLRKLLSENPDEADPGLPAA